MQTGHTPLPANSRKLPDNFRAVRLHLAREPEHPEGDTKHGYDFLMPLKDDGRIDPQTFQAHAETCRVRRFRPGEADAIGRLEYEPGGVWAIRYGGDSANSEVGFRFRDERFVPGEYVSIQGNDDRTHTFKVWEVRRP
jgi:hypothetical protein